MSDRRAPAVRLEVLGPLRAWWGDSELSLGPLQRRVVLAVLALNANRPLGREHIIDAVWGPAAPTYAVNLLQKHVSALRRVLEHGPEGGRPGPAADRSSRLLTWTEAGYLLTVPDDGLDVAAFDHGVRRAREARAAGQLAEAAEALRAALALWRGPVCDGLASPFLDAERDRLAERRIGALEERIEVDLALGNQADLVAELRQLVAQHPTRERLCGHLMLVLYRSGRQADALAAFQDARRYLNDELGIEPSEPLRQLHHRILIADPALAAAPAVDRRRGGPVTAAVTGPPTPAQLPYGMPDFTGREIELDRLHHLMTAGRTRGGAVGGIAVITGTAGIGKTALAVHWTQQVRDHFPDGQLYVNLRGFDPTGSVMEPAEAMRGFLDALAVPPQLVPVRLEAQSALFRSLLAGRRMLLLLDNARNADQIRPLLPGSPGCLVVVTSRNELSGLVATEAAYSMAIDLLTVVEARQLLARRLGAARVAAEPRAVDEIIAACARLPLVLAIVAARAAARPTFPLSVLADELREARGSLDAFEAEDQATNVRAIFSWSYDTLAPDAAQMFRLLALHPGPDIALLSAASLAGVSRTEARAVLAALARAHLVNEQSPGRFAFHDLLRAYAAEQAQAMDTPPVRRAALVRLLDHYVHSAHAADRRLNPHRRPPAIEPPRPGVTVELFADHEEALAWFTAEHYVLLATVEQSAAEDLHTHTWQLAWTLRTFFDRRGHWHDSAATQRAALAAAEHVADPRAQARAHRDLARALLQLDRDDEADEHLQRALDLYELLDNSTGQARTHLNLATRADRKGHHAESLSHAQRALDLFRTAGDRGGQADALNAVGWFHAQLGDHHEALRYCHEGLAVHQETGDREGEAHIWDSLGYAYERLGQYREAIRCYQRAGELRRDLGDRYYEAHTFARLGDLHHASGDLDTAGSAWRHALEILDEFGHPDAQEVRAKLSRLDTALPA